MTSKGHTAERLREIAAVIGCPIETFYSPESDIHHANMTIELLRLWGGLTELKARQRVLSHVRREARASALVIKAAE